jgi:hypothetical protein
MSWLRILNPAAGFTRWFLISLLYPLIPSSSEAAAKYLKIHSNEGDYFG